MQTRNISGRDLSKAITSEDILGKEVFDIDGTLIGVVETVLIDPESLKLIGISVDKGFLKKGLSIGKNYIDRITKEAIFLRIQVAYEIKGKSVFDKDGKLLGKVSSIDLHGHKNHLKSIHVKSHLFHYILNKEIVIPEKYIDTIGENVILNKKKEQIVN